ncbi:pilus assembly protein [bacterium]|nr:pilus assembly protein [bacterium]
MLPIRAFKGQGLVEYALILVFIAIVVIVVLAIFGTQLVETYSNIVQHI